MGGDHTSMFGQNTLVFEIFPLDISDQCPNFSNVWAYCGLGHPHLDSYRLGIIVCHLNQKTLYVANNLHTTVHGGISSEASKEYINEMIQRGYTLETSTNFNKYSKHLLVVGSNESVIIPNTLSFINYNTSLFDQRIERFFHELDLDDFGNSMLQTMDKRKLSSQQTSRGQPLVLNLSYSIQNCLDSSTIPGMFIPKLTVKDLDGIYHHKTKRPISHHMVEMMSAATTFHKDHHTTLQQKEPFKNGRRNNLFGKRIGRIVDHPSDDVCSINCFEGMTGGIKTQQSYGFCSHVDSHNSYADESYSTVIVACQASKVPVNGSIQFGSPTDRMFPFAIFYNRRGCESRCVYENRGLQWLMDVKNYYNSMSDKLKLITPSLFEIDSNLDVTYQVKERQGIQIIHRQPHADKHLQLSSFCDTIIYAKRNIPWWNEYYTIEYLYFVGLTCTPVSARFAAMDVFNTYAKFPPSQCLTLLLIESANRSQGGINKASGHRYSPSCGKNMPESYLYLSLRNMFNILQESKHNSNTSHIVAELSKHPMRGGVFKVGPLSAYEILSIYTMTAKDGNVDHVKNAVIAKNNNHSAFLQAKYGFTPSQQSKLLDMAKQQNTGMESHIQENVSCKMSYDESEKKSNRCDTTFSNMEYIVHLIRGILHATSRDGTVQTLDSLLPTGEKLGQMCERTTNRWFEMEMKDLKNMEGLDEILFVADHTSSLDRITTIYNRSTQSGSSTEEVNTKVINKRKRKTGSTKFTKDDIYRTEYGSRSLDYIVKRSGIQSRQIGKNKRKKLRKKVKVSDLDDYEEKGKCSKRLNAPNYITLIDKVTQKNIDFKTMASMLLGLTYQELMAGVSFSTSSESNDIVYWQCKFSNEILDIEVTSSDIDFCFDTTHYSKKDRCKPTLFRYKNAALRHLLLKIILIVRPNVVRDWMLKSDNRPIVVHENCHGKLSEKIEYIDNKRGHQRFGLHGWFVIFQHKKKYYGCDLSLLQFDNKGICIISDEQREHVYCFSS